MILMKAIDYLFGNKLKMTKVRDVKTPIRSGRDAGLDFFIPNDVEEFTILPGNSCNIASGIKMAFPPTLVGIFFNKSSIGSKGLLVGAQVIDASYRGEVHINLWNVSLESVTFKPGQKITQMLLQPIITTPLVEVSEEQYNKDKTDRGDGGFGSTGVK